MDSSLPGSSVHGISGKNTGVDHHFLLQEIFPTQGLNLQVSCLAGRFFITEPPGKPSKSIGSSNPGWVLQQVLWNALQVQNWYLHYLW